MSLGRAGSGNPWVAIKIFSREGAMPGLARSALNLLCASAPLREPKSFCSRRGAEMSWLRCTPDKSRRTSCMRHDTVASATPRMAPGTAWRVNQSGDGRLAVAAYGDGTIRWHRMSDGQTLLSLFVTEDAQRWVAF
eukprot:gene60772-83124_t